MFYVPLYVEALRTRPLLVFWLATSAQALLWLIVPLTFYWAPPGHVAELLAIGHEFPLNGDFGPPLAAWLAEIAFRIAGSFGVYALAQLCIVAIYWCVFALGRLLVGPTHAAAAVLLMAGIAVFTVPSPDFGPPLLAAALWAAALLFYWRALMLRRPRAWYALGVVCALILLTSQAALVLVGLIALFTALTERGRVALATIEPWIAAAIALCALFVHLIWLDSAGAGLGAMVERLRGADMGEENTALLFRIVIGLVLAHAGLVILGVLARGFPRTHAGTAIALERLPLDPAAVAYVKAFVLFPALAAVILAVLFGVRGPVGGTAPLLILSGLAVVIAAGDRIALYHRHILSYVWTGLLIVPVVFVPVVIALSPWTAGSELRVAEPAAAMGEFFAENFERRTGRPLALVSGDEHLAALIAYAAPSRPSIFFATDPARSPWVTAQTIAAKGAIVVWRATETSGEAPAAIKARFPDLIAEVPQTFARPVRGRLPPLRIGWGMIRPSSAAR